MGCCGSGTNEAKTPEVANDNVLPGYVLITFQPAAGEIGNGFSSVRVRGTSNTNYGIRQAGDRFKVFDSDQVAEPSRFVIDPPEEV